MSGGNKMSTSDEADNPSCSQSEETIQSYYEENFEDDLDKVIPEMIYEGFLMFLLSPWDEEKIPQWDLFRTDKLTLVVVDFFKTLFAHMIDTSMPRDLHRFPNENSFDYGWTIKRVVYMDIYQSCTQEKMLSYFEERFKKIASFPRFYPDVESYNDATVYRFNFVVFNRCKCDIYNKINNMDSKDDEWKLQYWTQFDYGRHDLFDPWQRRDAFVHVPILQLDYFSKEDIYRRLSYESKVAFSLTSDEFFDDFPCNVGGRNTRSDIFEFFSAKSLFHEHLINVHPCLIKGEYFREVNIIVINRPIEGFPSKKVVENFRNLQCLALRKQNLTDEDLKSIYKNTRLRNLELNGCSKITGKYICEMRQLDVLLLAQCKRIKAFNFLDIIEMHPHLEKISICGIKQLHTNRIINEIFLHCPQLGSLSIDHTEATNLSVFGFKLLNEGEGMELWTRRRVSRTT